MPIILVRRSDNHFWKEASSVDLASDSTVYFQKKYFNLHVVVQQEEEGVSYRHLIQVETLPRSSFSTK